MKISTLVLKKELCEKLKIFSQNIQVFESISSTNKYLKSHLKDNPSSELEICISEYQINGVGTKGKKWQSPPVGNIYLTFKINLHKSKLLALPIISALSICEAIELLYPEIKVNLKWPNDLFINRKKIGGILIEVLPNYCTSTPNNKNNMHLLSALIGIGININSPKIHKNSEKDFIDQPYTDLTSEVFENTQIAHKQINRCAIITNIIKNISNYKSYLSKQNENKSQKTQNNIDIENLINKWNLKDQYFQKKISVNTKINGKNKILTGIHNGITANGELNLKIIEQKKTISIRDGSVVCYT